MTASNARRLILAAALVAAAPVRAANLESVERPPAIEKKLEVHPYASAAESYDSNIFLVDGKLPGQPVLGSWITTLGAGARLAAEPLNRIRLDLIYDFAHRAYSNQPGANNAVIQSVEGRYWYEGPRGVRVRARDRLLDTVDPPSSELVQRFRRKENDAALAGGWESGEDPLVVTGSVEDTRHLYTTGDPELRRLLDRNILLFGLRTGWQVEPKTVLYAAYHRQFIHFTSSPSPSRDNRGHLVDLGAEGELAPKLTGRVQGGFIDRVYDAAPSPQVGRETLHATMDVALRYQPAERTTVSLDASRTLQDSTFDINQFYVANAVTLSTTHRLPWLLLIRVDGTFERDDYPDTFTSGGTTMRRRDDNYIASSLLEYPLKDWLKAGASFLYRARFSRNLSEQLNFREEVTGASLTATF